MDFNIDTIGTLFPLLRKLPVKQKHVLLTSINDRIHLPVPDNAIDISKNVGTIAEQVIGAKITLDVSKELGGMEGKGGDCVMSMIFKLKEISEKFGDSVKSHTIINPVMIQGFKEEEFVIHHIIQDNKRNLWIDVSNGRLRMCNPNIYRNECIPPIIAEKEGFTYAELQQQTKDWIKKVLKKKKGRRIKEPNFALVYLYFQIQFHNSMMMEYNPKGNVDMYLSNKDLKKLIPIVIGMTPVQVIKFIHNKNL